MVNTRSLNSIIEDPDLLELAAGNLDERRTVILELDIPAPRVQGRKEMGHAVMQFLSVEDTSEKERYRVASKASDYLSQILDTPPKLLFSADSFVAEVNAWQLRKIAKSTLFRAIYPNRKL